MKAGKPAAFHGWLAAAALACLVSCSAFFGPEAGRQAVDLSLPPFPASWSFLPELRWRVEWRDEAWRPRSAIVEAGGGLAVVLPRGREQAVLAWPESRGRSLLPAGARYPAELSMQGPMAFPASRARLVLGWLGGWTASVCAALVEAGQDPARYNLDRLGAEEALRGGDPWNLAPATAAALLAAGSFRVDLLDRPPAHPVILPAPGPWAGESALRAAPTGRGDGSWDAELPEGLWVMVGTDARLAVRVDEAGTTAVVPLP